MARRAAATTKKQKLYHVQVGSGREFGPIKDYATLDSAKQYATDVLRGHQAWCTRYNKAGLDAIGDALMRVDEFAEHSAYERHRINCLFDEHTGMRCVIELWKTRPT